MPLSFLIKSLKAFALAALSVAISGTATANSIACEDPKALLFSDSHGSALKLRFYADHASVHMQDPDALFDTPGIIEYTEAGRQKLVPAQIAMRGKSRFQCSPKPIRINFEDEAIMESIGSPNEPYSALKKLTHLRSNTPLSKGVPQKKNLFAGLGGKIKMVNECKPFPGRQWPGSNDPATRRSMLLREFYVYKMLELLNTSALAARLAEVEYVSPDKTIYWSGYSFFLEPIKKSRKRCGLSKAVYDKSKVDPHSAFQNGFLQKFAGNKDFLTEYTHNVEVGLDRQGKIHLFPYDFDLADLVTGISDADFHESDSALEEFISAEIRKDEDTGSKRQFLMNFLAQKQAVLELYESSLLDTKTKKLLISVLHRRFSTLARHLER